MQKVELHAQRSAENYNGVMPSGRASYAPLARLVLLIEPYFDRPPQWKIAPGRCGTSEALIGEFYVPRPLYLH